MTVSRWGIAAKWPVTIAIMSVISGLSHNPNYPNSTIIQDPLTLRELQGLTMTEGCPMPKPSA